jgi:hypothetical protein
MRLNNILENYPDEQFIIIDGFDDCVMGVENYSMRLIYSVQSIIKKLHEEMDILDAIEEFEHNIKSMYFGEQTPIYCYEVM